MNFAKTSFTAALLAVGMMAVPSLQAALVQDLTQFNIYSLPENSLTLDEEKVYVNQGTVGANQDLTGSIGANDGAIEAYWRTTDADGLEGEGNGFAVIKGGNGGLIHDLTFGVYNGYFEDVIFSLIPENMQVIDFTVTGFFKDGTQQSAQLSTQNGLEDWLLLVDDTANPFSSINIFSDSGFYASGPNKDDLTGGGFTQTKQWEVSGVSAVPVPAAAWLFGTALIGLAGFGRRSRAA